MLVLTLLLRPSMKAKLSVFKQVSILLLALAIVDCAPKVQRKRAANPAAISAQAPEKKNESKAFFKISVQKPECKTANDTSVKPPPNLVRRDAIQIVRRFQRVLRLCNGHQISDKIETVSSPDVYYEIKAQKFYLKRVTGHEARIRNTCTYLQTDPLTGIFTAIFTGEALSEAAKSKIGLERRTIRGVLSTSPTAFNGQVKRGENIIDYVFEGCGKYDEDGTRCVEKSVIEEGTIFLTVNYSEETLPGFSQVETCAKQEQKK